MTGLNEMSASGIDERDRLVLEHIPLLRHIVGRMTFDLPKSVDRDDLFGFGMLGLIAAADAWDSKRGLQFSTFAYTKIRGAILDEMRRTDFLPRGRREKVKEVDRFVSRLEQEQGIPPTPEEVASGMGITIDEVDEILSNARSAGEVSLDEGPSESFAALLSDPASEDPVGSAEWEETKNVLAEAIGGLPEQDRTVITLYYSEGLLLKEISAILGVTESRVSQIHSRAIYRLNRQLSNLMDSTEG